MEGNPGTLRKADVLLYRAVGVNRFSLGAQAKQHRLLQTLGRIHGWQDVVEGVALLREAGFRNLNLDLMFGLPGQTEEDWAETLNDALSLAPEHLSCYGLQVEEGTPLAARIASGECILPSEDAERAMYASARALLANASYLQYELSNFAKPGMRCRQNMTYWMRGDYLGFGCAAHSLVGEERWGNTLSLSSYLDAIEGDVDPAVEHVRLDDDEARFEAMMLGLRLTEGISSTEFAAHYGRTIQAIWGDRLAPLLASGLVEWAGERLRLTERGMDLQNTVLIALMD